MGRDNEHAQTIGLMREGEWARAAAALETALSIDRDDAQALRLLGTVHLMSGRAEQAVPLLEQALALCPDDARSLLNLGNAHLEAGRTKAARDCFERVVALHPASADGHYSLGLSSQRAGALDAAARHYRDALARDADALDAAVNLACIHMLQRDHERAETLAAQVLARQPGHRQAHLLRLRALTASHRLAEADRALADAEICLAEHPELQRAAGQLHHRSGRLAQAAAAYREAQRLGDAGLDTALGLARCLLESGHWEAAAASLQATAARFTEAVEAHELLATALQETGALEQALQACETALRLAPDGARALTLRARLLFALERDEQAAAAETDAMARAPAQPSPYVARVERCIARDDLAGALQACDAYLGQFGAQVDLLAARGFLLHALGRETEAARLLDYDRLLSAQTIDVPGGYANLTEFNAALCQHLRAHPSLSDEGAATKATQNGRQSGNLFFGERGPFADLEKLLWAAAARYIEALPHDATHPFLTGAPALADVHCWAVVLQRSGYQRPHIHPTAWLSGVYYPSLPDVVRDGTSQAGWIEFGAPPSSLACEPALPTHRLQPREGLLVLFPSYFYHRTLPYESDEERVSIAFDFTPRRTA